MNRCTGTVPVLVLVTGWMLGACASGKAAEKEPVQKADAPAAVQDTSAPATCDVFKQDCPAGQMCVRAGGGFGCTEEGKVPAGAPCQGGNDCARGLACTSDGCIPLCDAAHACKTGSCHMFDNVSSLGACQP